MYDYCLVILMVLGLLSCFGFVEFVCCLGDFEPFGFVEWVVLGDCCVVVV